MGARARHVTQIAGLAILLSSVACWSPPPPYHSRVDTTPSRHPGSHAGGAMPGAMGSAPAGPADAGSPQDPMSACIQLEMCCASMDGLDSYARDGCEQEYVAASSELECASALEYFYCGS